MSTGAFIWLAQILQRSVDTEEESLSPELHTPSWSIDPLEDRSSNCPVTASHRAMCELILNHEYRVPVARSFLGEGARLLFGVGGFGIRLL